jgi:hypothetical protein
MKDKAKVDSIVGTILEGVEWGVFSLILLGVFVGMFSLALFIHANNIGEFGEAQASQV